MSESIRDYLATMGRQAEALRAVAACPERGPVLPVALQGDCALCPELSECRAGRGATPGRVTLDDCLACVQVSTSAARPAPGTAADAPPPPRR